MRPEATRYGAVYFAAEMLATRNETLEGKKCLVYGSGNVAQNTIKKLVNLNTKPITFSDSYGYIYDEEGINRKKLEHMIFLKNFKCGRVGEYIEKYSKTYYVPSKSNKDSISSSLWYHKVQCAFPSANQNEIDT